MNCYTREFIDHYEPFDQISSDPEVIAKYKADLKKRGFQMIRTKWFSSLGARSIRAIRYRHGEPNEEQKAFMKKWVTF